MLGETWLVEQFEANRPHLRAVAYRMLGSVAEADDAVQECWMRVSCADTRAVENLAGWLTTVISRVCLNMLRSRKLRREEILDVGPTERPAVRKKAPDPEQESLVAESVGLALLVVLEKLAPAERVAFVLHDVFAVPFGDIAPIVGRSTTSVRKLASRARRRVRGSSRSSRASLSEQRQTVDAFLSALRAGDVEGLLSVLDPDVVRRADPIAVASGAPKELRGAVAVAEEALKNTQLARFTRPILVNGSVGIVVAPGGRLRILIRCKVRTGKLAEMSVIADPARVRKLNLAILDD